MVPGIDSPGKTESDAVAEAPDLAFRSPVTLGGERFGPTNSV